MVSGACTTGRFRTCSGRSCPLGGGGSGGHGAAGGDVGSRVRDAHRRQKLLDERKGPREWPHGLSESIGKRAQSHGSSPDAMKGAASAEADAAMEP